MSSSTILIIDDDERLRNSLQRFLEEIGYHVALAGSAGDGLDCCQADPPDLILMEARLPDMDGMGLLQQLRRRDIPCPVIVMTDYASVRSAVEAMKLGAEEYVAKPFDLKDLRAIIDSTLRRSSPPPEQGDRFRDIIGGSPKMQKIFDTIRRVANGPTTTVLLRGESGTGKELIAQAIHESGPTANYAFVEVNCSAIPQQLLEAELFGYERGAFTDAKTRKKGLLELADRGTLFLDEISLMSLDLQAKLLNVLEAKTFRRVGGTEAIRFSTRFVAATNEDLESAVDRRTFREDLYYRLNVISIFVPPLRERGDDILRIAYHYLRHYGDQAATGRGDRPSPPLKFSTDAEALLKSYPWPGNVRELKNVIERAVLLRREGQSILYPEDLVIDRRRRRQERTAVEITAAGDIRIALPSRGISLDEVEKRLIEAALEEAKGNISKAARLLHISRETLRYRIQKHRLLPDAERMADDRET